MKMDTQGMSGDNACQFSKTDQDEFFVAPMQSKMKCFTNMQREELKDIIREVIDEYVDKNAV